MVVDYGEKYKFADVDKMVCRPDPRSGAVRGTGVKPLWELPRPEKNLAEYAVNQAGSRGEGKHSRTLAVCSIGRKAQAKAWAFFVPSGCCAASALRAALRPSLGGRSFPALRAGGGIPSAPKSARPTLPPAAAAAPLARHWRGLVAAPPRLLRSRGNVAAGRPRLAAYGGSCCAASAVAQVCAPAALASRQP